MFHSDSGAQETERWFMPGEIGLERGREQIALSNTAFLTRAMSGVGRFDGNTWAIRNRLTPRLKFSHNLRRIFPPSLFAEHPEFFPEQAGRRIRPPEKSG